MVICNASQNLCMNTFQDAVSGLTWIAVDRQEVRAIGVQPDSRVNAAVAYNIGVAQTNFFRCLPNQPARSTIF